MLYKSKKGKGEINEKRTFFKGDLRDDHVCPDHDRVCGRDDAAYTTGKCGGGCILERDRGIWSWQRGRGKKPAHEERIYGL